MGSYTSSVSSPIWCPVLVKLQHFRPLLIILIIIYNSSFCNYNGLFPLPQLDSDPDSETDSCTMQNFSTGLDSDSDPLIEMYVIGMEIHP